MSHTDLNRENQGTQTSKMNEMKVFFFFDVIAVIFSGRPRRA